MWNSCLQSFNLGIQRSIQTVLFACAIYRFLRTYQSIQHSRYDQDQFTNEENPGYSLIISMREVFGPVVAEVE